MPLFSSHYFIWLIPGLTIYGFGMGITTAPLLRLTLFSTPISKGTAYAMISMLSMILQALGVELINKVYTYHNNVYFGGYCAVVGLLYLISIRVVFILTQSIKPSLETGVVSEV